MADLCLQQPHDRRGSGRLDRAQQFQKKGVARFFSPRVWGRGKRGGAAGGHGVAPRQNAELDDGVKGEGQQVQGHEDAGPEPPRRNLFNGLSPCFRGHHDVGCSRARARARAPGGHRNGSVFSAVGLTPSAP